MKPTKKIINEFPSIEESFIKKYETFKDRPTTQNYSAFCIAWGIWSTYRETFELKSKLSDSQITEIYFTIQDYSKDILIY